MKKLLIIKTGTTVQSLLKLGQDFEDWIIVGSDRTADHFDIVSVFLDEALPSLESVAGIIVTGSPAYVTDHESWSELTAEYLRQAVNANIPLLGICYGHQLLAYAMGGEVGFHPKGREIGTVEVKLTDAGKEDRLLNGAPSIFKAQVSHQQSVTSLPPNAIVLAYNEFEPYQAFRLGDSAWGLQFHPEFSAEIIRSYISERSSSLRAEGLNAAQLDREVAPSPYSASLLKVFADIVYLDKN